MNNKPSHCLFLPRGIVVIGASHNSSKLGYGLARNLVQSNYKGEVYFVNPKGGRLFNLPVYTSVNLVPDPLDLAAILVPAPVVPRVLQECGERGIKIAIVNSGGFSETGPEGMNLEQECLTTARKFDMCLVGPNSVGILDTHLPLNLTFLPPPGPPPGNTAFISQSGAICASVIDLARDSEYGLSMLISLGNQVDFNETDALEQAAEDSNSHVITLYLESFKDGQRFTRYAEKITHNKPIIAMKTGRFQAGKQAIASHTGALAGSENAYTAAFRRAGVIQAESIEEIFGWSQALAWCSQSVEGNVAVLTNAGGPGVSAADALEREGLTLAKLADDTRQKLIENLPAAASITNPIDMLASASPEQYSRCLEIILNDSHVQSVMVIIVPPPMYPSASVANAVVPLIQKTDKPVMIAAMGAGSVKEAVTQFRAAHIPCYRFPEKAASALSVLNRRAQFLSQPGLKPVTFKDANRDAAKKALLNCPVQKTGGWLPYSAVTRLLESYRIQTIEIQIVSSPDKAVEAARQFGYPVALKAYSPDLPHKSDVGGVRLDIKNDQQVTEAYQQIIESVKTCRPGIKVKDVIIQPMIAAVQEVITGAVRDPQFGPLVMFGSGGVQAEAVKDVAFSLAPATDEEVEYMFNNTWAGKKLCTNRSLNAPQRQAVKEIVLRLAQLIAELPQIDQIEINPLAVLRKGNGTAAVDVRAKVKLE
jgi:acetyltransferase